VIKLLYTIIFGLVGSVVAFAGLAATLIFAIGIFWYVLFGDDPWPEWTEVALFGLPVVMFIVVLGGFFLAGFLYGRRKEKEADQQTALQEAKKRLLVTVALWMVIVMSLGLYFFQFKQQSDSEQPGKAEPKVEVYSHGELCPEGECQSTFTIYNNGTYGYDGNVQGLLTPHQLGQLFNEMLNADYEQIKSRKFTGMCPTAYDGQEVVYTFYVTQNEIHRIASCEVQIDSNQEPFKSIQDIQNL
jgi:lysylphosphatidylglycerol synthetase-like protein (DUF2156 family)